MLLTRSSKPKTDMVEPFIVYEPKEDSYLILEQVRQYAFGDVLDMGTGSGILGIAAAKTADSVICADINPKALEVARQNAVGIKNIRFVHSDLFSYFKRNPMKFDLIIFNPPYLPRMKGEEKEVALAIAGGKHGYEILERFFADAAEFLKPYGKVLIVFSTLTGRDKIHEILENNCFAYQKLSEKEIPNEILYVYLAEKSALLRELDKRGVTKVHKLTKGHRGIIYTGFLRGKKIAIKKQREDIAAVGRMENEAHWLKFLNKRGIGAKFIFSNKDWFAYEYVRGIFFPEFLQKADKRRIKSVLRNVFNQLYLLDRLKINKEEMHNPYKHIVVSDARAVLLDFERTHATEKPHNVTQFCQYLISSAISSILKKKGFKIERRKIICLAAKYKKKMNENNLKSIINLF